MDEIDEFYASLHNGRCHPCEYGKCVIASGGFMFLGCYCEPYHGKCVSEIKNCPKDMRGNKKETTFDDYLKEQLKDPEFRKEYGKLCDEDLQKGGTE